MERKNPKIDTFLEQEKNWQEEMALIRKIILECGLSEELKWRLPCYMHDESNIVIIQGFKEYCAVMFFKGALLKDTKGILVSPGNSQAARQLRFTNTKEIIKLKSVLKSYIKEAIKVEKSGLKVTLKKTEDYKIPREFQNKLDKNSKLKAAFNALTPGRQRAYLFYFSEAKQSKTIEARVEKCIKQIIDGKGLKD